jgi:hypothetical protein
MCRTSSIYGRKKKFIQMLEIFKRRDHLGEFRTHGKVILKLKIQTELNWIRCNAGMVILELPRYKMWAGLMWLKIRYNAGIHRELSGSIITNRDFLNK